MILKLLSAQAGMYRNAENTSVSYRAKQAKKCTILTMSQGSPTDTNPKVWGERSGTDITINNVPALKLRFLSNRKWKTSINHVSLNSRKLSTNTNKYWNVQCACNEDSSFPCVCPSLFSSPGQWGGQCQRNPGSSSPICSSVFLVTEVWIISFVFPHVHVNNSPQWHRAIRTEISIIPKLITEEWDPSLENGATFRKSGQSDVPCLKLWNSASHRIFKQSSQNWHQKKSKFREQIFLPHCPKFPGNKSW